MHSMETSVVWLQKVEWGTYSDLLNRLLTNSSIFRATFTFISRGIWCHLFLERFYGTHEVLGSPSSHCLFSIYFFKFGKLVSSHSVAL